VQHQLFEGREMYLEAGKIPVHEGIWAPKTYSDKNPLLGVPFAYYLRSTLPTRQVPLDLDQLLAQKGNGQSGVYYANPDGSSRGTPWGADADPLRQLLGLRCVLSWARRRASTGRSA
jgi:hypothetical protein